MARILCVLSVLLVAVLVTPPARAADAVVGNGTSCTEAEFDAALATVQGSGSGTITFNCGGPATMLFTVQKYITTWVTVDGGGSITLNGGNARGLFFVGSTGTLTLQDITLANGLSSGDGGAIENWGSLTLARATLRDCNAAGSGGAIASYGPLTITDSLFENNGAANGGALYFQWALVPGGDATVTGSTFRNNGTTSTNGWGGAILLGWGAHLVVHSSDFDGNQARVGGAIHNAFANSTVELAQGTRLRNNSAGYGGGMYNEQGTATLTNVTLSGNRATYGGGLWNISTATLTNVTLSGNSAVDGGGLHNLMGTATLTNVTLSGNSALNGGGGIYSDSSTATLTHVTLSGNSAATGGGIWHYGEAGQTLTLTNVLLAHGASGGNCYKLPTSATSITSAGFNLSSDESCRDYFNRVGDRNDKDPKLGPLADNGGPTLTHLTAADSPAIDRGQCVFDLTTDQRGQPRPQGEACDIGAVERQADDKGFFLYLPAVFRHRVQ